MPVLTLEILKHAKRFHATVSFIADTGLKETTEKGLLPIHRSQWRAAEISDGLSAGSIQVQSTDEGLSS
jgi:hypothetical protein